MAASGGHGRRRARRKACRSRRKLMRGRGKGSWRAREGTRTAGPGNDKGARELYPTPPIHVPIPHQTRSGACRGPKWSKSRLVEERLGWLLSTMCRRLGGQDPSYTLSHPSPGTRRREASLLVDGSGLTVTRNGARPDSLRFFYVERSSIERGDGD